MTDVPVAPDPAPADEPPSRGLTLPEGTHRLPPRWEGTVGAAGGLVVASGVFVLMGELPDDSTRPLSILLAAILLGAGVLVVLRSERRRSLWSAGAAAAFIAVAPLTFLIVIDPDNAPDSGDATLILLLAALVWAALYFIGPTRGAAVLLGGALAAVWLLALVQTLPSPDQLVPVTLFPSESSFESEEDFDFEESSDIPEEPNPSETGGLSLLLGALFVGLGAALDRRPAAAVATPFFAVGDIALVIGVSALGADAGSATGGVLAVVVGALVAWIGARGGRRFTTWLAAGAFLGLVTLVEDVVGEENGTAGALILMVVGAAVAWAAYALGPRVDEDTAPS